MGIDEKLNYSIKADGYKQKGILEMNFSPNNVQLANNQQLRQGLDEKNITKPYPLITDRNIHPLTKSVNRRLQEEVLSFPWKIRPPSEFKAYTYESLVGTIFESQELRVESEDH